MGKCKEALDQAAGDMNKAIDILRKSGMASAVKKEGRETNEGLIGSAEGNKAVALLKSMQRPTLSLKTRSSSSF